MADYASDSYYHAVVSAIDGGDEDPLPEASGSPDGFTADDPESPTTADPSTPVNNPEQDFQPPESGTPSDGGKSPPTPWLSSLRDEYDRSDRDPDAAGSDASADAVTAEIASGKLESRSADNSAASVANLKTRSRPETPDPPDAERPDQSQPESGNGLALRNSTLDQQSSGQSRRDEPPTPRGDSATDGDDDSEPQSGYADLVGRSPSPGGGTPPHDIDDLMMRSSDGGGGDGGPKTVTSLERRPQSPPPPPSPPARRSGSPESANVPRRRDADRAARDSPVAATRGSGDNQDRAIVGSGPSAATPSQSSPNGPGTGDSRTGTMRLQGTLVLRDDGRVDIDAIGGGIDSVSGAG